MNSLKKGRTCQTLLETSLHYTISMSQQWGMGRRIGVDLQPGGHCYKRGGVQTSLMAEILEGLNEKFWSKWTVPSDHQDQGTP